MGTKDNAPAGGCYDPPPYSADQWPPGLRVDLPAQSSNAAIAVPPGYSYNAPPPHQPLPAPVQPAPQVVLLTQSTPPISPETTRRRRKIAVITGVIQVFLGMITIVLGTVISKIISVAVASIYFIAPPVSVVTGSLSIIAGVKASRSCTIATLVMGIVSSILNGAGFIFSCVMAGVEGEGYHGDDRLHLLYILCLTTCLAMTIVSIVQGGYVCGAVCDCCKPYDPLCGGKIAFIAQPDATGQLVLASQGMPVLKVGRQNNQIQHSVVTNHQLVHLPGSAQHA